MRSLGAIVSAVSDDVVAGLELLSLPPLTDGAVLLGAPSVYENSAPPRVVFEPVSFRFGEADSAMLSPTPLGTDILARWLARPLAVQFVTFRVHVWGIADPTPGNEQVPSHDMDATDQLVRQVVRSCVRLFSGVSVFGRGSYSNSANPGDAILDVSGWGAAFDIEIATPVTDYPLERATDTVGVPVGYDITDKISQDSDKVTISKPQVIP